LRLVLPTIWLTSRTFAGGQFQRAINLLEAAAEQFEQDIEDRASEQGQKQAPLLSVAMQAQLHMALGAAYQAREGSKMYVQDCEWAGQKQALDEYQRAVDLWQSMHEGMDRAALAESLKGVGFHSSQCTDSGYQGYTLNDEQRDVMAKEAEEACAKALAIYEELQHLELGVMYKVMGSMCRTKYTLMPGYRPGASSGPQHEEVGDMALDFYRRGAETFVRMGLDTIDRNYGSCLYNTGNAYRDRGHDEQALPYFLKAAMAYEKILGKEHHLAEEGRMMLVQILTYLGRCTEAEAVANGNELIEEGEIEGREVVRYNTKLSK
jgi:tetratricopeptide (TPR) repeat protein